MLINDDNSSRSSSPKQMIDVSIKKRKEPSKRGVDGDEIKYSSEFYENEGSMVGRSADSGFSRLGNIDDSVGLSGDLKTFLENREDWQEI